MKVSSLPTTSISIIKRINREESSRIFEIRWQVFEQKSKAWKEYFLMLSRKCNPCPIKMLKEWTKIKTEQKILYIEEHYENTWPALRVMRSKIFFSNRIELSFEDKTQRKEIQNLMEYTLYQSLFII